MRNNFYLSQRSWRAEKNAICHSSAFFTPTFMCACETDNAGQRQRKREGPDKHSFALRAPGLRAAIDTGSVVRA